MRSNLIIGTAEEKTGFRRLTRPNLGAERVEMTNPNQKSGGNQPKRGKRGKAFKANPAAQGYPTLAIPALPKDIMAPKYKLSYFNFTGLGEPIRYVFAYGNIDFEDNRFEMADWPKIKPTTPFGQVPLLEFDGKKICQSSAICRYLAKQVGLAGKTELDALEADMIVDTITDLRLNYSAYFKAPTEEDKAKKLEDIKTVNNPHFLSKFEEIAKKNGGHFVNNQLTWADLYFAAVSELMSNVIKEDILAKYPTLKALKEKVDNLPNIKAYRERRPKTLF